jgi:uncharacterized membrane protein YfcA
MSAVHSIAADWDTVMILARERQADHFGSIVGDARAQLGNALLGSPILAGWLVLGGASLAWMSRAGHGGAHAVTMMAAIMLASMVSSIAGFAFSAVCGAMLFHFGRDPVHVVQIMITCSIANQAAMTWAGRGEIDWRALGVYFAGGVPGLAIGVWVLMHLDRALYTQVFGAFVLAYGAYMMLRRPLVVRRPLAVVDFLAGFLGGITGGAAGFPGAFVTIWCGMKGWDKARQRAVFQPFILVMQVAALVAISLARGAGAGGIGFDAGNLMFVPLSLVGTWMGLALYRRLSDLQFARAVNVLLIASGLSYVA